jgi:hypothetical protein
LHLCLSPPPPRAPPSVRTGNLGLGGGASVETSALAGLGTAPFCESTCRPRHRWCGSPQRRSIAPSHPHTGGCSRHLDALASSRRPWAAAHLSRARSNPVAKPAGPSGVQGPRCYRLPCSSAPFAVRALLRGAASLIHRRDPPSHPQPSPHPPPTRRSRWISTIPRAPLHDE